MRKWQKQISMLLLLSCFTFLWIPDHGVADNSTEKGKLQIKTKRILKNNDEDQSTGLTELDTLFPELFTEEVKEKLEEEQMKKRDAFDEVKEVLFVEDIQAEPIVGQVREGLFTEEYSSSFATAKIADEETADKTISNILFYSSIVAVIGIICVGIALLLRSFTKYY